MSKRAEILHKLSKDDVLFPSKFSFPNFFRISFFRIYLSEKFKEKDQKIADLEAKLADTQRAYQEYREVVEKNLEKELDERMRDTIKEFNLDIAQLKQQLAEKDAEIKKLVLAHFESDANKPVLTTTEIINQDKISFAVDKLTEVKKLIENKLVEFDDVEMKMIMGLFAFNITCQIDNQIEELKKEMK